MTDLQPAFAQIAFDPSKLTTLDPDRYTQNASQLSPEEIAEAKKFLDKPTQTTLEIMFLLKSLYYRVQMEEEKQGTDAIAKILSKRKDSENIEVEVENVGKAEPLVINTERGPLFFTKVRHNALKMSILFIDKNQIDLQLLEESERLLKSGKIDQDKTLQGLSKKEIHEELNHRRLILKQMRTLYARMLLSEWNPHLSYTPLSEIAEIRTDSEEIESAPDTVQKHVHDVLNEPIEKLEKQTWFKKLSSKSFDTWVDLAKQEKAEQNKGNLGNEELMIVLYDGSTGQIQQTNTIRKSSRFTLDYWKTYWKMVWEKPAYDQDLWKSEKGLGKIRVLLTGDYLMGLSFGLALSSLSFLVSSTLPDSLPHGLTAFDVAKVSFGWSLFFGVFSKTWQNFVYRGNDFVRFLKNWSTGLGQSYNFNLMSDASLAIIDKNGNFDPNAIKMHTDVLVNQSIKTTSKTSLQEIPRFRSRTGEAEGTLQIKDYKIIMPWKNNVKFMQLEVVENTVDPLKLYRWVRDQFSIKQTEPKSWEELFVMRFHKDIKITLPWLVPFQRETSIPRKNFEGQTPQLVTTPVGLLSRFGYMVWGIPLGHILYAILGPIGEIRQIRYKVRYADDLAKKYGEDHALTRRTRKMVQVEIDAWNSLKVLNIPGTQFVGYYAKIVPQKVLATAKELSLWLAKKASYRTYAIYDTIQNDLKAQDEKLKESKRRQNDLNFLNTVQTTSNKTNKSEPHPQQFKTLVRFERLNSCSHLFQ